jgi:hypothetical protein
MNKKKDELRFSVGSKEIVPTEQNEETEEKKADVS